MPVPIDSKRQSAEHAWRSPVQIASQWSDAVSIDRRLLETRTCTAWWSLLERLGITLFATREQEHLVMAMSARAGRPRISSFVLPHPSGLVADRPRRRLFVASTRNPNQVYTLQPSSEMPARGDVRSRSSGVAHALVPTGSTFYPGRLYLHDLALVGDALYGNAVGFNAVARLGADGFFAPAWWPMCIERRGRPAFSRNYIQLNSIAAGPTLGESFFSASSTSLGHRRPGHLNYPVDGRGVVFSGATREPMCTGLTRPHSARLARGRVWVANSGYGEVGVISDGRLDVTCTFPGWTRGVCVVEHVAFVGVSRVLARYACYAPGLDVRSSRCGIRAIDLRTGDVLATLDWPAGHQIFALEWMADSVTSGFRFDIARRPSLADRAFFHGYALDSHHRGAR